jgi:hypothetical protein
MRDRRGVALAPSAALWPPDDTEESVLGTSLHQTTITNLRLGINEAAALAVPEGGTVPWQADGHRILREGEAERRLREALAERDRPAEEIARLRRRIEDKERGA